MAAEALANHSRCNNSFVYDLFQALYRSSLTCPNCRRQSNTFDPFLSVSLPIPQKTQRPVYVTVVYLDAQPKQVRIGLLLNQCDTARELRQTLASDTKIPESQVSCSTFLKMLLAQQNLTKLKNDLLNIIFVFLFQQKWSGLKHDHASVCDRFLISGETTCIYI